MSLNSVPGWGGAEASAYSMGSWGGRTGGQDKDASPSRVRLEEAVGCITCIMAPASMRELEGFPPASMRDLKELG